jgi:ferric-dicitrate binding protein FerR (iron transport regulator)
VDCSQCLNLIGPSLDGELETADAAALTAHLAECADCRAAADGLRLVDTELRQAFAPRRQAAEALSERVIASLPCAPSSRAGLALPAPESNYGRASPALRPWLSLLMAAAAGFLIAVLIFQPWERNAVVVQQPEDPGDSAAPIQPIARLAVATGPVEVRTADQQAWSAHEETAIARGAAVRTGPEARCELATSDGSALRLNTDTEVVLPEDRKVELARGQLWSFVCPSDKPFEIHASEAKITAQDCRLDLASKPGETVVTVVEGSAQVHPQAGEQPQTVSAGQKVMLKQGRIAEAGTTPSPILDTGWVNELLILKGADDPEFVRRIDDICAQIGQAKLSHLYEDEIRRLGDHCVVPLVRFIQSPRSAANPRQRVTAARIVADVAQPRSIPELIGLLADNDPQVRSHTAEGLHRLTGRDQGMPANAWQQPWTTCAPTHRLWQDWWQRNKGRYPLVAPTPASATVPDPASKLKS